MERGYKTGGGRQVTFYPYEKKGGRGSHAESGAQNVLREF